MQGQLQDVMDKLDALAGSVRSFDGAVKAARAELSARLEDAKEADRLGDLKVKLEGDVAALREEHGSLEQRIAHGKQTLADLLKRIGG